MNENITEEVLLKAGFYEISREEPYNVSYELLNPDIHITNYKITRSHYARHWYCEVSNGIDCANVDIQTIEHFNKIMELMDIDFKLKEEEL